VANTVAQEERVKSMEQPKVAQPMPRRRSRSEDSLERTTLLCKIRVGLKSNAGMIFIYSVLLALLLARNLVPVSIREYLSVLFR